MDKKAKPFLKLTKENGLDEYVHLKRNLIINVKEVFEKKCTGFFKDGEHQNCPNEEEIRYGKQCLSCKRKDDYLLCAQCNGSTCAAVNLDIKKRCFKSTHFLYLTLIGNKVKVGITRAGRYLKRWIEQGSDYSCIIGSGNGMEMRKKEHLFSKEITDRIRNSEKIKLFMKDNREILEEFLKEKNISAQIIDIRKHYEGIDSIPKKPNVYDGLLNGRIVCVKGKIVVFEKDNEYYYYDLNNLIGHIVEIEKL